MSEKKQKDQASNTEDPKTKNSVDSLEEEMDMSGFDGRSSSAGDKKDLWLFLIIIDIICLCCLGFFLYKNLSAKLFVQPVTRSTWVEEVVVEQPAEIITTEKVADAKPVAPLTEAPAQPNIKKPVEKVTSTPDRPAQKKESVLVTVNPKSKYRRVTFRYFDEAKSVEVISGFTMAKPRAMTRKNGVWEVTLSILPGDYKYLFIVDGEQRPDPYAEQKDGRSVLVLK